MDEEGKFVEKCHKGHYFPYPMVLIYRSHHILLCHQNIPRHDNGPQNIHQFISPDRNYAFTRDGNDQVELVAETVGLSATDEDDQILNSLYFDMELVSSPHFLISRTASSSVWIQDLGSRTGTFLNGEKLKPECKLKVYDADVVSIGISHLDPACDLRSLKYFVFKIVVKPRKYSLQEIDLHNNRGRRVPEIGEPVDVVVDKASNGYSEASNEAVDAVLHNDVIVSQIVGYLNLPDLKSCRFINEMWDEQISRIMKKKAAIRFSVLTTRRCPSISLLSLETLIANFQSKVEVMTALKLENIKVSLQHSRKIETIPIRHAMFSFMDIFRDQIKCLHLEMQLVDASDAFVFFWILNRFPFLEEIELALTIYMNCNRIILPAPMETVHRMTISQFTLGNGSSLGQPFIRRLLSVFPNAETVGLLGDVGFTKSLLTFTINGVVFLPFQNLKSVAVEFRYREDLAISFLQKLITYPEVGLESLKISYLRLTQPVLDAVEGALERHAPTLKSLHLKDCHYFGNNENLEVTFPHFPKLKQLEVDFEGDWKISNHDMTTPLVTWNFPSGRVSYTDDFPSLEFLHVKLRTTAIPQSVHLVKTFFEAFLPLKEVGVVQNKRMKKVHFEIPKTYIGDNKMWECHFMESLENIFPNANLS